MRSLFVIPIALLALLLSAPDLPGAPKDADDGMKWHKDIRTALEEAEDRGVCLMIYLTRDD